MEKSKKYSFSGEKRILTNSTKILIKMKILTTHYSLLSLRSTLYALRSTLLLPLQSLDLIEMIEAHFFSFDTAFGSVFFKFVFEIFQFLFCFGSDRDITPECQEATHKKKTQDPGDDPHNSVVSKLVEVHTQ